MSKNNRLETRLERANMYYGNSCLKIYDSCKNRRTPVAVAEQLLNCSMEAGGAVEGIMEYGYDAVLASEAASLINKSRYLAKLMYDNSLCSDRSVRRFLASADELCEALAEAMNPEPEQPVEEVKPVKEKKKKEKVIEMFDPDPDGFDDIYEEPVANEN